ESATDVQYSVPLAKRRPGSAATVADVAAQSAAALPPLPERRAIQALDDPQLHGFAKRWGLGRPRPPPPPAHAAKPSYPPDSNVVSGPLDAPAAAGGGKP